MANRLTKIVTRTGDDGTTGLGDGARVPKSSPRIAALGDIDELNSVIGLVRAEPLSAALAETLLCIQHDLFDLGGEICIPGRVAMQAAHLARIEADIERIGASLPPLREFILPGGSHAAAAAHLARTVCRRAERALVALAALEPVSPLAPQYLNRLSDLLFMLARAANAEAGVADTCWQPGKNVQ